MVNRIPYREEVEEEMTRCQKMIDWYRNRYQELEYIHNCVALIRVTPKHEPSQPEGSTVEQR